MTRMTQPGNFGECASVTGRVQPEEIEGEDVDEPGKHRMDDAQKETRKKEERERVMPWMGEDALEESLVESTTHQ